VTRTSRHISDAAGLGLLEAGEVSGSTVAEGPGAVARAVRRAKYLKLGPWAFGFCSRMAADSYHRYVILRLEVNNEILLDGTCEPWGSSAWSRDRS